MIAAFLGLLTFLIKMELYAFLQTTSANDSIGRVKRSGGRTIVETRSGRDFQAGQGILLVNWKTMATGVGRGSR